MPDIPNIQWKYVICHLDGDTPTGTNDQKVATEFSMSEDCYVIEMPTCKIMHTPIPGDGEDAVTDYVSIAEQRIYKLD